MQKKLSDRLSPAVKYSIFLVGIISVTFIVILGSFIASFHHLDPSEQAAVEELSNKLLPFPFIGSIILVAFISTMVSLLFRYYIIPVLSMAEQTRLITSANPDYRISPEGAREVIILANMINESADAFQSLKNEVDGKILASNRALKEERNRLAALMSELPLGVIVCTMEGRILLYNNLAKAMLRPVNSKKASAEIGLGRSIYGVLEQDPLTHAIDIMRHGCEQGQTQPILGLMTKWCGARFLRVNMAPVTDEEAQARLLSGFILTLEDITGEIEADSERDKLLQKMIDSVQNSLGQLHQEIQTMNVAQEEDNRRCDHHRHAIERVSADLEGSLAMARQLFSEHRKAYGNREVVRADTLLSLIAKNLEERFSVQTDLHSGPPLWFEVDSYAIVQVMTTLAGLLKAECGIQSVMMSFADTGSCIALKVEWPGKMVDESSVRNWLDLPLFMDTDGSTDSPSAIIERHHGTITIQSSNPASCQSVQVVLPMAIQEEPESSPDLIAPRPISYEFDLFNQPGQEVLGKVPLRNLTFVAFDTETTGLNPSEGDEIIQLGAVRIVNSRLLPNEAIDQLVNPQREVPRTSVKVHGIDPDLLPSQPVITEVLPKFHDFVQNSVLVAHNAAFDMRFLQLKQDQIGLQFDNPVLDTLLLSSVVHPNQEGHSLDAIAARLNIEIQGRHTALGDALATAEVLLKLIPLLEAQGVITLEDALLASKKSSFAKIDY